jgi:hypothetical protein
MLAEFFECATKEAYILQINTWLAGISSEKIPNRGGSILLHFILMSSELGLLNTIFGNRIKLHLWQEIPAIRDLTIQKTEAMCHAFKISSV